MSPAGGTLGRAAVAVGVALFVPSTAAAQDVQEPDSARIPAFLEAREVEPLVVVAGQEGIRLALEVTAWGRPPERGDSTSSTQPSWDFRLSVEAPSFLANLVWEEGEEGSLAPGERSFEAHLSFDVVDGVRGGDEPADLALVIRPSEEGVIPDERRIVIPLELRERPRAVIAAHPLSWQSEMADVYSDAPDPFSRVLPPAHPAPSSNPSTCSASATRGRTPTIGDRDPAPTGWRRAPSTTRRAVARRSSAGAPWC
jgi:hypothetical protein